MYPALRDILPTTSNLSPGDVVPIPTHPENIATGAQTVLEKQAIPVLVIRARSVFPVPNTKGFVLNDLMNKAFAGEFPLLNKLIAPKSPPSLANNKPAAAPEPLLPLLTFIQVEPLKVFSVQIVPPFTVKVLPVMNILPVKVWVLLVDVPNIFDPQE